jgi:hypothetical protein
MPIPSIQRTMKAASFTRIGMTGVGFFLVKGLLWLLAPLLFAYWR